MRLLGHACAGDGTGLVATGAPVVTRGWLPWLCYACGSRSLSPGRLIGYWSRCRFRCAREGASGPREGSQTYLVWTALDFAIDLCSAFADRGRS
jgi:hypothetical protein